MTFSKLGRPMVWVAAVALMAGLACSKAGNPVRSAFGSSAESLAGSESGSGGRAMARKDMVSFGSTTGKGEGGGMAPAGEAVPAAEPLATAAAGPTSDEAMPPSDRDMETVARTKMRVQRQQSGQLTAGDWDDNLNLPFFLSYTDRFLSSARGYPHVTVSNSAIIVVRNEAGRPVPGARVSVSNGERKLFSGVTASDGRVLFVPSLDGAEKVESLTVSVEPPADQPRSAPVRIAAPTQGSEWPVRLPNAEPRRVNAMDLAFVVDTTGSMGDELEYLKGEIQGIADSVRRTYGDVDLRLGLVLYRDQGDEYVTRKVDFTDLATFRTQLDQQSAGGGGDMPEAMDEGLVAMNELSWRGGNVARVAFLVADAPAHNENAKRFLQQADVARRRGVRLYTVAASGVDDSAEFLMRQASQLTLARYLFLTDDSGVGNSHAEPHIPCYQVQHLSKLMARTVRSELTGVREEARDVIRTVGQPLGDGVCRAANGVAYRY
jgi:hypothetical protein